MILAEADCKMVEIGSVPIYQHEFVVVVQSRHGGQNLTVRGANKQGGMTGGGTKTGAM